MSLRPVPAADPAAVSPRYDLRDFGPLVACSLIWGSTWFAITFQLGTVPPTVSIAYRFGLAATVLFGWLLATRRPLRLDRAQHLATFAQGVLTFGINYIFVYEAEKRLTSAVVAVIFAAMAFANLVLFRVALRTRAPRAAWMASGLGVAGVAVLFAGELGQARMDSRALLGLGFGLASLVSATAGNLFARRAQLLGVEVGANTAWGMAYGAGLMVAIALASGQPWRFEATPGYVGSLVYLSLIGSVTAFLLYFGLARRRGYVLASYISAVTPAIAMLISAVFEHAHWGIAALAGLALVMAGQVLLARAPHSG